MKTEVFNMGDWVNVRQDFKKEGKKADFGRNTVSSVDAQEVDG